MPTPPTVEAVDPFDLPDWVGETAVVWRSVSSLAGTHRLTGELTSEATAYPCDVLAGDLAYPCAVLDERWRHDAHQAWTHGQVLAVSYDGRLTLLVPGTEVTAEQVLEAVRRLAKAVGAPIDRFSVTLRL